MRKLIEMGAVLLVGVLFTAATFEDLGSQHERKTGLKDLTDIVNRNFSQLETNLTSYITDGAIAPQDLGVASNQIVIGGDGGTGTQVTVSGDMTTANDGTFTIGAAAVTPGKMSVASNQIVMGNDGGTGTQVTVSGDMTTANDGTFTVSDTATTLVAQQDTNTVADATSWTPRRVGDLLVGTVSNDVWVSAGATTNDWIKVD